MAIILKTPAEIALMRQAGRIVAQTLNMLSNHIRPGVTTGYLDTLAEEFIRKHDAKPSFKGYRGFPKSICTAINDQVVHGIPDSRILEDGDIVTIDVGAQYRGLHGDAAKSFPVGKVSPTAAHLLAVCAHALDVGIAQVQPGAHLSDIGAAIQPLVENAGFSVVRQYCGHGLGRSLHEDPQIFHYGQPGHGPLLRKGMTFTIEPMINEGKPDTRVLDDGWTVVTADGSLSAQYEHSIVVTDAGCTILTAP
ncbi:MAG: type I methionyl aminopeptidase [Chloroflexi bacterium]|nr:type I methionyl aminopeptidase [Chloroflexota bacterium]